MNDTKGNHKPSFSLIARLLVLSIGVGFTFLQVILMVMLLAVTALNSGNTGLSALFPLLNATIMIVVVGCLMLPGLVLSLMDVFKVNIQMPFKRLHNRLTFPNLLFLAWMLIMGASFLLLRFMPAAQWLLPLLQIPAILIPIFWLYRISTRSIQSSDAKRNWNVLGLDLGLQPVVVLTLELIVMFIIGSIGIVWLSGHPDVLEKISHQMEQLVQTNFNGETMDRILVPYLEKPIVIFAALFFIAGIVPLLEELVKPMLVLRWLKQPLSESQGFLIGLIGGSAFALWENMSALSNVTADSWFFVVIARYGTSILHMTTAAVMGWAWMKSFRDHRFARTAGIYLLVVFLHGGWNFFTMLQAFSTFSVSTARFPMNLTPIAPFMMVAIVLFCLGVLLVGGKLIINHEKNSQILQEPSN